MNYTFIAIESSQSTKKSIRFLSKNPIVTFITDWDV